MIRRSLTCMTMALATLLILAAPAHAQEAAAPSKPKQPVRLQEQVKPKLAGLPLVYAEDFETGPVKNWTPTDPSAWKHETVDGRGVYSQYKRRSDYEPPVRSPYNRALLDDIILSDFVLDVRLQSTIPDYGHRDMCLFFGYQDESHFYYVHLGKKTDDHANQIFIVNDKPRTKISTRTTPGTDWTDGWHHARVIRRIGDGTIEVYFDNMDTPIMTATDTTFTWGQVGIGSFDDTGRFDRVLVYGTQVEKPQG